MLETRALASEFGVEVMDLDLHRELLAGNVERLARQVVELFETHELLLFRDQSLDAAEQVIVAEWLGPISMQGDSMGGEQGGKVMNISNSTPDGIAGEGPLLLHSDFCFMEHPLKALLLYGVEIPDEGGNTLFAHAGLAYRDLPPALQEQIAPLEAVHNYDFTYPRGDVRFRASQMTPGARSAKHPVVWSHPDTGEPILYVNRLMTDRIEGLPEQQSERLLDELIGYIQDDAHMYEHVWRVGDLVIWDNRLIQHGRTPYDDVSAKRTLRRVPVEGGPAS